jgi:RHS repeat-associated protein
MQHRQRAVALRRRRGSTIFAAWTVLLALSACAARAQEHANTGTGFSPNKAFQIGDVDHINSFNGNLVVTLPLGESFRVSPTLSYGLTLTYNSNIWEFQQDDTCGYPVFSYNQAIPIRRSNAGMGWMVTLGQINPPFAPFADNPTGNDMYLSPDGGLHTLYPKLHNEDAAVNGVSYTRDGTYLRLSNLTTLGTGSGYTLDFPDGTTHVFNSQGLLIQMRDRFNNLISVSYGPNQWTIFDTQSSQRSITVNFTSQSGAYSQIVSSVVVSAFAGAVATYVFNYATTSIPSAYPSNDPCTANWAVPLLTSLTLPDASSYQMSYITQPPAGNLQRESGSLNQLTLPTLGQLSWTYQIYSFPTGSSARNWGISSAGVAQRQLQTLPGTPTPPTGVGTWTYTTTLTPVPSGHQNQELINTVRDPLGTTTKHYFSVWPGAGNSPNGTSSLEYGLPYSRSYPDLSGTTFLSTEVDDATNTPMRATYVTYEMDTWAIDASFLADQQHLNQRLVGKRAFYLDDPRGCITTAGGTPCRRAGDFYQGFDGLGHYRQAYFAQGTFDAGPQVIYRTYNPSVGSYVPSATPAGPPNPSNTFVLPATTAPWVIENFDIADRSDLSTTARAEICFDPNTGFVTRERTLKSGTSQGPNDALVVYTPVTGGAGAGEVGSEDYYGGDLQALPYGVNSCTMALPPSQYHIDHTYLYGTRATSKYAGVSFLSLDQTIDPTGMVASRRDTPGAGLTTSYSYDTMGRLTKVVQPSLASTVYTYTPAALTSSGAVNNLAAVTLVHKNSSFQPVQHSQIRFDDFGRVWQEAQLLPGSTFWNVRETDYDPLGRKAQVSEVQLNPTFWTRYSYDPFGRPASIQAPDGHSTSFSYQGVHRADRTVTVGTAPGAESPQTTTEIYDRQGRLYQVTEPSGANGAPVTTTYAYDVGGRLSGVSTPAVVNGVNVTQNRSFAYDNRGFLAAETHPEKGTAGNGTVSYLSYDARGHIGRKIDGPHDLGYQYDSAERLVAVAETGGRPLKSFTYAPSNSAGWSKGRLLNSQRYNYPFLGVQHTVVISQGYTYGDPDGRVSQRQLQETLDTNPPAETFVESFAYDAFGHQQTIVYPYCIDTGNFSACTAQAQAPRTVANTFSEGFLTSVASTSPAVSYANSISYYPNLMVSQVAHGNGITDIQARDPQSIRRPASITASSGGVTQWASGTYVYDGVGDVTAVGSASFVYDGLSRITSGTVVDQFGAARTQTYTYDAYGNLRGIGGNPGRQTPTDPATNRLTSCGLNCGGTYDAAGNITNWNGALYEYDAFNQLKHFTSGSQEWLYMYDADDERIWSFQVGANPRFDRWTLRNLDGKVLRTYEVSNYVWSTSGKEDAIYRDGLLLATDNPDVTNGSAVRHLTLDHLGTPRLITDNLAQQRAYHLYFPFGEEVTNIQQDSERLKFTGHERDLGDPASAADDLDYMHARHANPLTGRFLSVDTENGDASKPQTWNRYVYALNSPLKYIDRDGRNPILIIAAIAAVYGFFSASEAANAPTAANTPMVESMGAAGALQGAAEGALAAGGIRGGLQLARSAASAFGIGAVKGVQFATEELLISHFEKHGAEVGAKTVGEYLGLAQKAAAATGRTIATATRANGDRLAYNFATKEFTVVTKEGIVRTYFKSSAEYWKKQLEKVARAAADAQGVTK